MAGDRKIMIEIDGPGSEPAEIETRAALDFLSAYVELLERSADLVNAKLTIRGIEIRNKCSALECSVSSISLALDAARRARPWLRDPSTAPRAIVASARRANGARRALRGNLHVLVRSSNTERGAIKVDAQIQDALVLREHTEVRATVVRAGGDVKPTIELRIEPEDRIVHFVASREDAASLGKHLYRVIDAVVEIERDEDLTPMRGRIHTWQLVEMTLTAEQQVERFLDWVTSPSNEAKLNS